MHQLWVLYTCLVLYITTSITTSFNQLLLVWLHIMFYGSPRWRWCLIGGNQNLMVAWDHVRSVCICVPWHDHRMHGTLFVYNKWLDVMFPCLFILVHVWVFSRVSAQGRLKFMAKKKCIHITMGGRLLGRLPLSLGSALPAALTLYTL